MSEVTLITCTGDRPEAFRLCEHYMARQTHQDFNWIVVDDGETPTETTKGQQYIRLEPAKSPPESFRRNLSVGLSAASAKKVLFIEDDDLYLPFYVELMCRLLDRWEIAGEGRCRYYHVGYRMWKEHTNTAHASLCQTGMRVGPVTAKFLGMLRSSGRPQQADGSIWKRQGIEEEKKFLIPCSTQVIATKGLPGRKGLGIHHTYEELQQNGYQDDPHLQLLTRWAGDSAANYASMYLGKPEEPKQVESPPRQ